MVSKVISVPAQSIALACSWMRWARRNWNDSAIFAHSSLPHAFRDRRTVSVLWHDEIGSIARESGSWRFGSLPSLWIHCPYRRGDHHDPVGGSKDTIDRRTSNSGRRRCCVAFGFMGLEHWFQSHFFVAPTFCAADATWKKTKNAPANRGASRVVR